MNIANKQDDEEVLAEYNATVIEIRLLQERLQSLGQQLSARLDGGRNTNLLEKMRKVEQIG